MVEHLTVVCCGGLRSEHKCSGLKVLIFTSPVSCLSSIFLSPGLLRLCIPVGVDGSWYNLLLPIRKYCRVTGWGSLSKWYGWFSLMLYSGPFPGRSFPNYWNCMNSNDPWSSFMWKLVGCFQYFHFHELLSSRELPGESSRNNSMWSGYYSCLSCPSEGTEFIRTVNIYTF